MPPNIFMSYSRRETGFVDDLTYRLEKAGFNVWLDYRRLIPGTPWAGQIDKGLKESDVVLLVVSKESINSKYVDKEWRHVLDFEHKRVIMVIFEAVKLPPELKKYEWVDFRGSYETGLKELISQLNSPIKEAAPAPETGFKAPLAVWLTAALALYVGLFSLSTFWTILLPWVLVPLAWRVIKRDYNYQQTQTALWALPLGLVFTTILFGYESRETLIDFVVVSSTIILFPILILLGLLLRSAALQRWGKPEANRVLFANQYNPTDLNPTPVSFFIDHAPQDKLFARDIAKELTRHGHIPAKDMQSAEAVFVLVSRFKTDTEADTEQKVVFPVLVQTAQPSEKLSHVQWIDYRRGLRKLDILAKLLSDPAKLLAALGVRPTSGAQTVTPANIASITGLLSVVIAMEFGGILGYPIELIRGGILEKIFNDISIIELFNIALILLGHTIYIAVATTLIYFMIKALRERRGFFASIPAFLIGQIPLFILLAFQASIIDFMNDAILKKYSIVLVTVFPDIPVIVHMFGGILVLVFALFRLNDIRRWFPARAK